MVDDGASMPCGFRGLGPYTESYARERHEVRPACCHMIGLHAPDSVCGEGWIWLPLMEEQFERRSVVSLRQLPGLV